MYQNPFWQLIVVYMLKKTLVFMTLKYLLPCALEIYVIHFLL